MIDPVVSALSSVVGRYDGYVEKYAGDALLALFGAPRSHDDDADRSLLVALEMHAELERIKPMLHAEAAGLTLHVGVTSGHGIARLLGSEARTDYAVLGDSVILAQRLESAAPAGSTYVSDTTYRLTRTRFEFEPVGELTLKGRSQPVRAWRLIGRRAAAAAPRSRLVGRGRELDQLLAALVPLGGGRGAVAALVGDAGVGKSRLVAEVAELAGERGFDWLQARCLSYGGALPYWPYVDLLRRAAKLDVTSDQAETLAQLERALAADGVSDRLPLFARVLGLPTPPDAPDLEPDAYRRALHAAFDAWLSSRAAARPAVLVLEDLHWADPSSLALTGELARTHADRPLVLLLVSRPDGAAVLDDLGEPDVRVVLEALDTAATGELLAELFDGPPPPELTAFIHGRSGGNPFFAQELLAALRDEGAVALDGYGWQLTEGWNERRLPPTIEGVLAGRLDRLPAPAAELLQLAAVIGRRVPVELLRAVAGTQAAADTLRILADTGFLEPGTTAGGEVLTFRHALVQDAAYERLLRRHRRELHVRVAETAERLYGSGDDVVDLLARHLYLGGSPDAFDYLRRAGDRARRLYANEEAILHLERALELRSDDLEVGLMLADLEALVGRYDQAYELYEWTAAVTGDVRAWSGAAATLRRQGRFADALARLDEAVEEVAGRGDDSRSLWLERAATLIVAGNAGDAAAAAESGLAASDAKDVLRGQLLLKLAEAEGIQGRFADALGHALGAQHLLERSPDGDDLATALRVVGGLYRELARLDDAAEALRHGLELSERVGSVEEVGGCLVNLAIVEAMRGNVDEGIALVRRAVAEFERIGHGSGRVIALTNLAEMYALDGDYDEAVETANAALELAHELSHLLIVPDLLETLATVHLRQGRPQEAARSAEQAAEEFLEIDSAGRARDCWELAGEAWAAAGDEERAEVCRARAHPPSSSLASGSS